MAKSARASSKKFNNQRKAASVFAPAENARAERLSAKLLELAKQAKPESSDVKMNTEDDDNDLQAEITTRQDNDDTAMDVETVGKSSKPRQGSKVITKRRQKKSKIVFQKYSDRVNKKKKSQNLEKNE